MLHEEMQQREHIHAGTEWHEGGWMFTQPNGKPIAPRRDRVLGVTPNEYGGCVVQQRRLSGVRIWLKARCRARAAGTSVRARLSRVMACSRWVALVRPSWLWTRAAWVCRAPGSKNCTGSTGARTATKPGGTAWSALAQEQQERQRAC
jgi:hypothetical protein